jgi:hypothetical protein
LFDKKGRSRCVSHAARKLRGAQRL